MHTKECSQDYLCIRLGALCTWSKVMLSGEWCAVRTRTYLVAGSGEPQGLG